MLFSEMSFDFCSNIPLLPYLCLNATGIFTIDNLFNGSWYENIARFKHQIFTFVFLSTGESNNCSVFNEVIFQLLVKKGNRMRESVCCSILLCFFAYLGVNSLLSIYKSTIMFNDTDTSGTGSRQITTGVQTDITKTLDDKRFSTPARCRADCTHIICFVTPFIRSWNTPRPVAETRP